MSCKDISLLRAALFVVVGAIVMTSYVTLANINFLITIFFGCFVLQALWYRRTLARNGWVGASGAHGIQRLIMVNSSRAMMKDRKNRTIDLLSIAAIIGAVICFI